ncbi:MAG TPA: peptidylprolyl isomerase [Solirubrobacteraceae bacterium]|nr:peptidylprolyl isomerase [Solirubrobacteraceae bacterium]
MRRALVLIVILLAALMLVACGKDDPLTAERESQGAPPTTAATETTSTTTMDAPTATTATTATTAVQQRSSRDGCRAVAAPVPATNPERRRTRQRLSRTRRHTAVVRTNCGQIQIRLDVRRAPKTTSSFAGLARNKFFDGLTFHRIAKPGGNDYVIQGGDPLGTGNGGPGYAVVEAPPRNLKYRRYVVAMAKTQTEQPGTSGSQFFIVTAAEAPLEPDYALLGEVVGGKAVVRRIAAVPTDPATEMPIDPVVITSVRIRSTRR